MFFPYYNKRGSPAISENSLVPIGRSIRISHSFQQTIPFDHGVDPHSKTRLLIDMSLTEMTQPLPTENTTKILGKKMT